MKEARIGVYVCWCGSNIAKMVDVENVAKSIGELPNVVVSKDYKYMCSDPGQDLIVKDIKENNLTHIVVSSCSPRIHEITFRKAIQNAGLNPYMLEMANIREQVSWVHTDRIEATIKALDLIRGAVNRVRFQDPLDTRTVEINSATLIIGGGISGLCSALEIANAGKQVFVVEKADKLGGVLINIGLSFPYMHDTGQMLKTLIKQVKSNPNINIFTNATIKDVFGYIGNFNSTIYSGNKETEIKFGNVIVATGLKPFDPSEITEYGYGKLPNVITSFEFEKMLKDGKIQTKDGKVPQHIAIIHCVGSRNKEYHEYCSRTCCLTGLKYVNQISSAIPHAKIYETYADMRTFGKGCEEFYTSSSKKNVMFLMFDQKEKLPKIKEATSKDNCNLILEIDEKLSGETIEVPADLVVLLVAMEAHADAKEIAHSVGISLCGSSFYIEKHPKLDPVATTTDGVYIVGSCQSPKDIPDSISQAKAASARILSTITKGKVSVEVTTAEVNEDICCGCQTCISVCPYTAISFDEEKGVSVVNEVLCKGCGTCGSTCPTGAIKCKHFTDQQIFSQIEGIMSIESEEV